MNENARAALKRAFLEADRKRYAALDLSPAQSWTPSPPFEKKIASYRSGVDRTLWRAVNTAGKCAAVILLATVLLISCTFVIREITKPTARFTVRFSPDAPYNSGVGLTIDPASVRDPDKIVTEVTRPTCLPEGYRLYKPRNYKSDFLARCHYVKSGEKDIIFEQYALLSSTKQPVSFHYYLSKGKLYEFDFNGRPAYFWDNVQIKEMIWNTDDYVYRLQCPSNVSDEDIIAMAASVPAAAKGDG